MCFFLRSFSFFFYHSLETSTRRVYNNGRNAFGIYASVNFKPNVRDFIGVGNSFEFDDA